MTDYIPTEPTKTCKSCNRSFPLSNFHKGKAYKGGYRPICKDCKNPQERYRNSQRALEDYLLTAQASGRQRCIGDCREEKCLSYFDFKNRRRGVRWPMCSSCYGKGGFANYRYTPWKASVTRWLTLLKFFGPCIICEGKDKEKLRLYKPDGAGLIFVSVMKLVRVPTMQNKTGALACCLECKPLLQAKIESEQPKNPWVSQCGIKKSYGSWKGAKLSAIKQNRGELAAYKCPHCKMFHLGHLPTAAENQEQAQNNP